MADLRQVITQGHTRTRRLSVAGVFSGIGGFELGMGQAGAHAELLCESWAPAKAVLAHRLPGVPIMQDIRSMVGLPSVDVLTAGFPCTDLSSAGGKVGIGGSASGLVGEVFRLLSTRRVPWVVLENVQNMLFLGKGAAMQYVTSECERLGYRWAYRLVDSQFTGVPQRRRRVVLVASTVGDPTEVLFADDAGAHDGACLDPDVFGFYWTEGNRSLGWARDAVPPLKGTSSPAIWVPHADIGHRLVTPAMDEAERLQGFKAGWVDPVSVQRITDRWKLVGNAITVGVARWVGARLHSPGPPVVDSRRINTTAPWPKSAYGHGGKRWEVDASMWPTQGPYQHLRDIVALRNAAPLSQRAAAGFYRRVARSGLRTAPGFLDDVYRHAIHQGLSISPERGR